jgi:transposase
MVTGKVNRLSISTRHLIIEYSKKDLSAVHILRLLHRKHNVTTTRQSIFKFVKRYSSTGVLAPATRRDNNRFPRKLTDFHRRCIDMWLCHNSELTLQALVDRLFRVFDIRVTLRTCPRYTKPWVGTQGHYSIANWSATKTNFVEYSGHWVLSKT